MLQLKTELMLILSSASSSLEFWSVNDNSIYRNYELKVIKNKNFLGEIFDNLLKQITGIKFIQYHWIMLILIVEFISAD